MLANSHRSHWDASELLAFANTVCKLMQTKTHVPVTLYLARPVPANLPLWFAKLQVTCDVLVATPTTSLPPAGLMTLYVRVVLGACAQVETVSGPMISPVTAVVTVPGHAPLSTGNAMRVTPNSGHSVAFRLHVTVTWVGLPAFKAVLKQQKHSAGTNSSMRGTHTP